MEQKNIFIYGLSGSGKDTISNFFRDEYYFIKLRIANTIKSIICETNNLTFNELEEQKRNKPELRQLHHTVGKILDKDNGTNNRIKQLIDGTSLEYQHFNKQNGLINKPRIICDCRCKEWSEQLLNAGWIGIFLFRTGKEYKDSTSFTEQNMFLNGNINELLKIYYDQMYLIYNDDDSQSTLKLNDIKTKNSYVTDGSEKELLNIVERIYFEMCGVNCNDKVSHTKEYYDTERNQAFKY